MLDEKRIKEAESNVKRYIEDGLLKKQRNETAKSMYIENAELSIVTAQKLLSLDSPVYKPYLWVIVTSYYSMYYMANAALLALGYKIGDKISHKVTSDALIVHARDKLKSKILEEYEDARNDALELTASRVDAVLQSLDFEREKRSKFQYQMDEQLKKSKALTSLERAKQFLFELKKLL